MCIRNITEEVLSKNTGAYTAVEICEIIKRDRSSDYKEIIKKYGTDQELENEIYRQAVRVFQLPAKTLPRQKLQSDYVKGAVAGKRNAKFWVGW